MLLQLSSEPDNRRTDCQETHGQTTHHYVGNNHTIFCGFEEVLMEPQSVWHGRRTKITVLKRKSSGFVYWK
jgi:hypothetical protein